MDVVDGFFSSNICTLGWSRNFNSAQFYHRLTDLENRLVTYVVMGGSLFTALASYQIHTNGGGSCESYSVGNSGNFREPICHRASQLMRSFFCRRRLY